MTEPLPIAYLHDTHDKVAAAIDTLYCYKIKDKAANEKGTLYADPLNSDRKIAPYSCKDKDLLKIPFLGRRLGIINKESGIINKYAHAAVCYNDSLKSYAAVYLDDYNDCLTQQDCAMTEIYDPAWVPEELYV